MNDIVDKTWKYVCEIKSTRQEKIIYYHQFKEQELFDLFQQKFPTLRDDVSINDYAEFARLAALESLYEEDFKAKFNEFLRLKEYEFYFEIGKTTGFSIDYQIGQGKLMPYNKLPTAVQDHFTVMTSTDVPRRNYNDDSWFIHFSIQALGPHKSIEKAIKAVKQSLSIFRLTYLYSSNPYFPEAIASPFKYVGRRGDRILSISYGFNGIIFYRNESYDKMISDLSKLVNKIGTTEIEKRIINALDFFGMIENVTSLRMKFLLVVFALEGLILSGDDKDYSLRKKLPEKIAFLILEPSNWESNIHYLGMPIDRSIIKSIADVRLSIATKLEKVYDKRSAFAHPRSKKAEDISIYDFDFVSKTLRLVVCKLIELNQGGVTHIDKDNLLDIKSLNGYLERLKFG
jgi:hypothetical protein